MELANFQIGKEKDKIFLNCKQKEIRQLHGGFYHKKICKGYIDHEASWHSRRAAREVS